MLTGRRWRMLVIIGLLALGGCGAMGRREVAFTPVATYDEIAGTDPGHYRGREVLLALASTADEKTHLESLLPGDVKASIRDVALDRQVLIAVFQGEKYSSGYRVEITRVVGGQSDVYVYARFEWPQPKRIQAGGTRSPVSVVSIERAALPAGTPLKIHLLEANTGWEVLSLGYAIK